MSSKIYWFFVGQFDIKKHQLFDPFSFDPGFKTEIITAILFMDGAIIHFLITPLLRRRWHF